MADDKILYYPDESRAPHISEQLRRGESLTSANEGISLDKFQNIHITQKPQKESMSKKDELSVEERILRDFKDKGKVVWHTYSKSEPIEDMDLDFKILAAYHSLKKANKLCKQIAKFDEEWREKATEDMNTFMYIFEEIESNLKSQHGIDLPDTVEEIQQLRSNISEDEILQQEETNE